MDKLIQWITLSSLLNNRALALNSGHVLANNNFRTRLGVIKSDTFGEYWILRTRLGRIDTFGGIGHVWGNDTFESVTYLLSTLIFIIFNPSKN